MNGWESKNRSINDYGLWSKVYSYFLRASVHASLFSKALRTLKSPIKLVVCSCALCIKSTQIDSLFYLTSQSVGINRIGTHTNKGHFTISFNGLSCQITEKWATQFWAFFPILRNIKFFPKKSLIMIHYD